MKKKLLSLAVVAILLPAFGASADESIKEVWKTPFSPVLVGNWSNATTNWSNSDNVMAGANPRFATAKDGKIYTVDQLTQSIAEVTHEGTLMPKYYLMPNDDNPADFYGCAISMDEVGNFIVGMNYTTKPNSSLMFSICVPPTDDSSFEENKIFTIDAPQGWNIGRLDCIGRVLGDLTKEAYFTIVPEVGYTSKVRIIKVTGDGTLDSIEMTDLGDFDVEGNYTQQNIAQPAYHTLTEAKAANGISNWYYSSANGTNNYYANYNGATVNSDIAPNMRLATFAGTNGFDTFTANGKRYYVRNWSETTGARVMNIIIMDGMGNKIATWENPDYQPNGGYSSIITEPLADNTVNIYVYNSGNPPKKDGDVTGGAAAMLNFDPAKAPEAVEPEIPTGSTADKPYIINTTDDLVALVKEIKTSEFYVKLESDLDMDGVALTPIKTNSTIYFDGQNHTISNLKISAQSASLFLNVKGSIKNLGLVNTEAVSGTYGLAAPLADYVAGEATIENCFADGGSVTGFYAGGLLGGVADNAKATIRNCYSTVNASSVGEGHTGYAGGIVGCINNNTTLVVENAYSAGEIKAYLLAGGIVGGINNSYNGGSVTLKNVATYSPSISTDPANPNARANLIINENADKFTTTLNNYYTWNGTLVNGATNTEGMDEIAITHTILKWNGYNSTEVNAETELPILAWQHGKEAGINDILVDDNNAPAVYYNLQGVQVTNPENGIYIVRRGNKVAKELVK